MFRFFFKKNFCDGWDNFFFIIISNLIPLALMAAGFFSLKITSDINPYLPNVCVLIFFMLTVLSTFSWGANAAKLADFETPTFSAFFSTLKYVWKIGLLYGLFLAAAAFVFRIALAYYFSSYLKSGSALFLILTALLCWFGVICVLALQWFIPLYFLQDDNGFLKCLKKSFIIFFDNAAFTVEVFILNLALAVLTFITVGIFPGLNGILLSCTNALRLRLYKYDWLEEHPEFLSDRDKRSEVPWDELLKEDKESLGDRKFTSFIFPWK